MFQQTAFFCRNNTAVTVPLLLLNDDV